MSPSLSPSFHPPPPESLVTDSLSSPPGISPVEVESSEGEALDNLDGGELFEPEKILNQDSEEDYLNYTQTLEESLAEIGVYTIPVANETDFVRAEAET